MLDLKALNRAIEQIAQEKGIEPEAVKEAIEAAIATAYRKEYRKKGEIIKCQLDLKTGQAKFWQIKTVVDENTVRMKDEEEEEEKEEKKEKEKDKAEKGKKAEAETEEIIPLYNPDRHILIEEAKKIKADIQVGEELELPLEEQGDFGRIASQAAKQVILQKLRETERDSVKKEYQGKEGEIISGVVQRIERGNVFIDLGRATGIMF